MNGMTYTKSKAKHVVNWQMVSLLTWAASLTLTSKWCNRTPGQRDAPCPRPGPDSQEGVVYMAGSPRVTPMLLSQAPFIWSQSRTEPYTQAAQCPQCVALVGTTNQLLQKGPRSASRLLFIATSWESGPLTSTSISMVVVTSLLHVLERETWHTGGKVVNDMSSWMCGIK